jgi:hypothetical protein
VSDDDNRRMLRTPCEADADHGMQHGYYTRADDGREVELPCAGEGCAFRARYRVAWPDAYRVRPAK